MTHEELLLELKDISPPAEPGWWLIAPGYLVIGVLVVLLLALLWILLLRHRARRKLNAAELSLTRIRLAHLENQDSLRLARDLARWLKQVSLLAFPQARLEAVTGAAWLSFLDQTLGDSSFSRGDGKIFADAIYRQQAQLDDATLLLLCERWLQAVKPQLLQRGHG